MGKYHYKIEEIYNHGGEDRVENITTEITDRSLWALGKLVCQLGD